MLNYIDTITDFIRENFESSNPDNANVKMNTEQILDLLFRTFPVGCISDYELNDILIELGFNRFTYVVEFYDEFRKKKEKKIQVTKSLEVGWCLKSHLNLRTEEIESKEKPSD